MAFVFAAFLVLFILFMLQQWDDLSFYKKNGWDFSIDNGDSGLSWFNGDSNHPSNRMSNRERVLFGRPMMIATLIVLLIPMGLILFQ